MAAFQATRRPLGDRYFQGPSNPSLHKQPRTFSGAKRPHSPDHLTPTAKRARGTVLEPTATTSARDLPKERKLAEREQKAAEFKDKYSRAFPSWKFYLDSENMGHNVEQILKAKILSLGGKIDVFFSSSATHLITDLPLPTNLNTDKENTQNIKPNANKNTLKSPIKLIGRGGDVVPTCGVVTKALEYGLKVWSTAKLDSVLSRCLDTPPTKSVLTKNNSGVPAPQRSLSRLLQTEKILGSTERDPTQKRHDYHYFTRGACFILLEDIRQYLATINFHEYPIVKDKSSRKPWPVLHCHPLSRNPFTPFDDREKKRWDRLQQAEKVEEDERNRKKKELAVVRRKALSHAKPHDLRRTMSMSHLNRRLSHPLGGKYDGPCIDLDDEGDDLESAKASGYIASGAGMGYIAASGNSVGITSTTGTTSTSGRILRNTPLNPAIEERLKQHIVTSRKFPAKDKAPGNNDATMGPPSKVPSKQPLLKKSKSTNTLKLPKREEGVKPGYCESCREKFSDFATHTESKKHRKFAANPANFVALDRVLSYVHRRTRKEVDEQEAAETLEFLDICKQNRHIHSHNDRHLRELSSP